ARATTKTITKAITSLLVGDLVSVWLLGMLISFYNVIILPEFRPLFTQSLGFKQRIMIRGRISLQRLAI
ncbi:MAG: hypothetical protein KDJ65_39965, partial [Anaerolineae bacterium]|nr:hypothetical protein [Anaerolineae bacterium]